VGHPIGAAFAFHRDHFLWGHSCSVDGYYYAADPCSNRVTVASSQDEAMADLDGTLTTPPEWLARMAVSA
jgi:hypothetical protein